MRRFSFSNIFRRDFSGYSQSWGTHIRQAVYLQIATHTHKEKEVMMANLQRALGDGGLVTDLNNQSTISLNRSHLLLAWGIKKYSKTYNHQRSSAIYFIKISPWWSTDSRIWPWRERHIYSNPRRGGTERNRLGTKRLEEKLSSAERVPKGKAWAILALRSLNGHLLIFFICPVKTRQTYQLKRDHDGRQQTLWCTKGNTVKLTLKC